jgi:NAD(P)-dependent dehydrogenase (short-subunit alcohol dehydrogenase family)
MSERKTIMVVDGQGGGLGKAVIERLREARLDADILAIGTNSSATGVMLRAGATNAATGENALIYNAGLADFIVGPIGMISANSMLGEISASMAGAIAAAPGMKLLIPMNKCNLYVGGVSEETGVTEKIDDVIGKIRSLPEMS